MKSGIGRGLATPLLVINFVLYLVAACFAGWALNRIIDHSNGTGEGSVGNKVTATFLTAALVACMIGLASLFAGLHHLRVWRGGSLAAAAATSLIAWLLTLLAMGLAAKEIHVGGYRPRRLKVVEALIIILSLFELLYLLSLHAGFLGSGKDSQPATSYTTGRTGTGYGCNVDEYGHHTDIKIPVGHVGTAL